ARGIDVHDVSLVVHVDPPAEHKAYLHRAGRTARAGESGTVVTLVMNEQRDEVAKLIDKAGVDAQTVDISTDASPAHNRTLAQITGAQSATGIPVPEPGGPARAQVPKKQAASKNQANKRGASSRGTVLGWNHRRRQTNAVARGWISAGEANAVPDDLESAPTGEVQLNGFARLGESVHP